MREWIEIRCICGKVANYLPTVSGKVACDNTRCHKLLDVPKITEEDQIKMAIERR